jgi:hypothetical protein
MNNLRRYEKDETQKIMDILHQMNELHAKMAGRDSRPERKALIKAILILQKEVERAKAI